MKKIGLIGGGAHSRSNHLPALRRFVRERPALIELSAFCDINPQVAQAVAAEYGFARSYTSLREMLASEALDGVIAVTPVHLTKSIAAQIIEAGLPLVIEKPPGLDLAEAKALGELVAVKNVRAMVSVNRRFDPALVAARDWLTDRKVEFFHATMFRHERREPQFLFETGLHIVDAMRWFAGDIASYELTTRDVNGVRWYRVEFLFTNGVAGLLEIYPTTGMREENYTLSGDGFRVLASNGEMGTGEFIAWEKGQQVIQSEPAKGEPGFIKNGTLAETAEFIASLIEDRPPKPSVEEVLPSLEIVSNLWAEVRRG